MVHDIVKMRRSDTGAFVAEAERNAVESSDGWEALISEAWQKCVESILNVGTLLVEAKATLAHGTFESMVEENLPFGPRTARRLMKIAKNPVLANRTHASVLPPSWMTLYELAKLPEATLKGALGKNLITPETTRAQVKNLDARVRGLIRNVPSGRKRRQKMMKNVFFERLAERSGAKLRHRLACLSREKQERIIEGAVGFFDERLEGIEQEPGSPLRRLVDEEDPDGGQ